jgi:hypothetical protein
VWVDASLTHSLTCMSHLQGISIIAYLRAMHSEEWANFTQR